jgi:hypothetical protein
MRNLSRVLTGTINGASEVPDPGVRLTRGLGRPQGYDVTGGTTGIFHAATAPRSGIRD